MRLVNGAAWVAAIGAVVTPAAGEAATETGSFRLAFGHAARPAFYFVVSAPGTVTIHVNATVAEPVSVALYAGQTAIERAQGAKDIRLSVSATREHLANGHEWAVIVSGSTPARFGDGRITVELPDDRLPTAAHPLDRWLRQHPAVAFHLTWSDRGRVASYSAWPVVMRAALRSAFDTARAGRPAVMPDPLPNAWKRATDEDPNAIQSPIPSGSTSIDSSPGPWMISTATSSTPSSRGNFRDHWGYDGDMPVSQALAGTLYAGSMFASLPGYDQMRHYTAGCQGTAGLFASVLRAANIPVRPRSVSNDSTPHATLLFLSEDRALTPVHPCWSRGRARRSC